MGALELLCCAVHMTENFIGAVLAVGVSVTPAIEMKALPIVASTFLYRTDSILFVRAVDLVRAICAVFFMVTAPSSRNALARLATEVGSLASVLGRKETACGLILALRAVLVTIANP